MMESGTLLQDRFLVEGQVGRGGMGAVYSALDQKFGSRVAIKERHYEDPALAFAFEQEARLLNTLHHPILPHVSDYFTEGGRYFLVMEYIEGEDLSRLLKENGAFPASDVVRWMTEILDGLDYLHSQDPPIIHRDIKPGNLKLTSRGNIILLDFGLAKESTGHAQGAQSVFGYSRRYSPLEQIEGTGTDVRSDIFSFGATIYHLLTGEPPVDVLARASAIIAGRPDPLRLASEMNETVPVALARIVNSAMALSADQRFVSAKAVRSALHHAVEDVPIPSQKATDNRDVNLAPVSAADIGPAAGSYSEKVAAVVGTVVPADPGPEASAVYTYPGDDQVKSYFQKVDAVNGDLLSAEASEVSDSHAAGFKAVGLEMVLPGSEGAKRKTSLTSKRRVRLRVVSVPWSRSGLWAAALIACLLLVSFALYRSAVLTGTDAVPMEQVTSVPAESTVQAETESAAVEQAPSVYGETAEAESDLEAATAVPTTDEAVVDVDDVKTASKTEKRSVGDLLRDPLANKSKIYRIKKPAKPQNASPNNRTTAGQRPKRNVREIFEPKYEPVSSIELILSGQPRSPSRREIRRQQRRQLSMWEQEELRRRRRESRRWELPF